MTTFTTTQASTSWLTRLIIRNPVTAFLGMVYGFTWLMFVPSFLSQNGIGVLPVEIPAPPFVLLSVVFGITLPAFFVYRLSVV